MAAREIGQQLVAPEQEGRQCWICFETEPDDLIAPCQCTGSMKWVRRSCLNRWRVDATNPRNFTHCRHCGFKFRLVLKRDATADQAALEARKRNFILKTVSHFIMMTTLLQIVLILTAMGIRAIDTKETLVTEFGFPQVEHTPPAGEGDYWNAIRYHKSTYYASAVLVGLFLTGLIGTLVCCCHTCGCKCDCDPCPSTVHHDPYAVYWCGDWCGDCCFFCGRGECNCCDCDSTGTCVGDCCPGDCGGGAMGSSACDCGDCGEGIGAIVLVILAVVVIAFILVGLVLVFMALVTWSTKVVTRYFQISELRVLTGEYEVEDLSKAQGILEPQIPVPSAPTQEAMESGAPSAPPPSGSFAITDVNEVNQSLRRDLQAVYGMDRRTYETVCAVTSVR